MTADVLGLDNHLKREQEQERASSRSTFFSMAEQPPFFIALTLALALTLTLALACQYPWFINRRRHVVCYSSTSGGARWPVSKMSMKEKKELLLFPLGMSCRVSRCLCFCICFCFCFFCCCCRFLRALRHGWTYCTVLHRYLASIIVLIVILLVPLFFRLLPSVCLCYSLRGCH